MPDYSSGKIYTIRCITDATLIYVGSTIESLSQRLTKHRYSKKATPSILFYSKVNDWNDWYIELYENFSCNSKEELNKREGEVIREIGTLNTIVAGRTQQEYRQEEKEIIQERKKEYYENNKEQVQEYKKKYYEEHSQQEKDRALRHYINNKDEINEKKKEKITCECGKTFRAVDKSRHNKTLFHQAFIAKNL